MCAVATFLDRFGPGDREQLRIAIDDRTRSVWQIVDALAPLEPRFSGGELIGHRNKRCNCEAG